MAYPESCIFGDILKSVETKGRCKKWIPKNLQLTRECYCHQHKKMCLSNTTQVRHYDDVIMYIMCALNSFHHPRCPVDVRQSDVGLIGAPCILFSRLGGGWNEK